MKKSFILCMAVVLLVSCHNYKRDAVQLTVLRDSLQNEANFKDASIVEFLNDFNEIQASLDSIKKLENLVTAKSAQSGEFNQKQKDLILEDIALLNELINKNKEQVSSLQARLNNANSRIGNLDAMIVELKTMVSNLEKQTQDKDAEIYALSQQVQNLNTNISSLNQRITEVESENQIKTETIQDQTIQLNKAYYVFGTNKELKENGIIDKTGGLLGIGRTALVKEDFNHEYFSEIDVRDINFIPLMVKKAEIISVHPSGSFHVSGSRTADTLYIDNKTEFWKASKYLVVLTR
ncbi:MAG: hypothetical protein LBV47_07195 [Bacteroidales bacterium]|jgi:peptidoglycan hydrolase CwlO-like protein|nr:hypothetical protein [Bacteroidales bacterium]